MTDDDTTYCIVRFYQDMNRERRIVQTGLTLEEAQDHCNDPETSASTCSTYDGLAHTRKYGLWFDGYTEE
jgi:hypothetical protein